MIDIAQFCFQLTCSMAWKATPLFLAVLLLTSLLRQQLSGRVHGWLWSAVILRLLLPVSIPTPFSMEAGTHQLVDSLVPARAFVQPPSMDTFSYYEQGQRIVVHMPSLPIDASYLEAAQAEAQSEIITTMATRDQFQETATASVAQLNPSEQACVGPGLVDTSVC